MQVQVLSGAPDRKETVSDMRQFFFAVSSSKTEDNPRIPNGIRITTAATDGNSNDKGHLIMRRPNHFAVIGRNHCMTNRILGEKSVGVDVGADVTVVVGVSGKGGVGVGISVGVGVYAGST